MSKSSVWAIGPTGLIYQMNDEESGVEAAELLRSLNVFFAELSDPVIVNYPHADGPYTALCPGVFTDGNVINAHGQNYYRACDAFVSGNLGGPSTFCVRRLGHPPTFHEDYAGHKRKMVF